MKSNLVVRIRWISVFVVLFATLLVVRLYVIQIVHGEAFSIRADRQYIRPSQDLFDRGSIFFEDKDGRLISAATLKMGFTIAINPSVLENPEDAYEKISPLIELEKEAFFLRAGKKEDPYEVIAERVEPEVARRVSDLNTAGVGVYKDRWRFYPGGTLGAQTIGFVAFNREDLLAGVYGIERYYNDILERDAGDVYVNFFAEIFTNLNKTIFERSKQRAGDIVTSIEPSVQLFLEDKLFSIQETWNSKLTAGVIINPQNGEIYAMGAYPAFDLNNFQIEENVSIYSNPSVENVYEMGSIIKPLTISAGLDSGAITATTTYYDRGFVELDGYTISNFDGKGRGRVDIQQVLSQSLNTGASFVVSQMGNDVFADYMKRFGIGEETGIDLPNESAGLVSNLDSPRDIEYATASFGQGIAMTPIATIRAMSVLANGGVLITPHVATKIKYRSGLSRSVSFNDGERVLKKSTSEEITRMLVKVVDEALLGGTVKFDRYSVAAKTGTAQIAYVEKRGYYDDRFFHSFFGYFPAYDPQFLIFLYTVEPKEVRYASQTLTRPFIDMVQFLINYYEIPPDR
ncbi:penicillin-binding protein 2 [Patescibacteria group bacterium]|nr:penicillin-binding protein 2 [Patescibacteria group bacterium]